MRLKRHIILLIFACLFTITSSPIHGQEIKSRYTTIIYDNIGVLRKFNRELYMGRLKYTMPSGESETIEDEVKEKIDLIVEKVQTVLDMFPNKINFSIVIHLSTGGVQQDFKRIYNKDVDYIAFFSPGENTVFYSADNGNLRVVSHEIGHVVAEHYFTVSPPPKIHEVLAQYAETHITD
jgi:hypothetical protein